MTLHIITRVSRNDLIDQLITDVIDFNYQFDGHYIIRHLLLDIKKLHDQSIKKIQSVENPFVKVNILSKSEDDPYMHQALSTYCRDIVEEGWIHVIDDDNKIHENLFRILGSTIFDTLKTVYVGHQDINYKDFSVKKIREALPTNMKKGHVDSAQAIFHHSVFKEHQIPTAYTGDSEFIESLYTANPKSFDFINIVIAHYNFYQKINTKFQPTFLYIGDDMSLLKTTEYFEYTESFLNVIYRQSDSDLQNLQNTYNIDLYISERDKSPTLEFLNAQPIEIRRRWIEVDKDQPNKGDIIYGSYMSTILQDYDKKTLISFFTSTFNTGKHLLRLYHTLKMQTYTNWEWVVVDDSTDDNFTYKILQNIAKTDNRVKLFSFDVKTGGVVGEAKYRAATLCTGEILVELDHDDLITADTCFLLSKASAQFPHAGFFYSDSVEVENNFSSRTYGDFWAFGYGNYREEVLDVFGRKKFRVPITPNINPKTIRHIVSVPNHLRAWRRELYLNIGGHNRRLPVADDYDLIVRTFLNTIMVHIEHTCYIQMFHGHNYQDKCRPEISRRVDMIRKYYNGAIKQRFSDLGATDWCDTEYAFLTEPARYDDAEQKVNLSFKLM